MMGKILMGSENWKLNSAADVASALDWVRRRMEGNGLVLVAVGVNSVAYSKDVRVEPEDAVRLLEAQLATLRRGFQQLKLEKVTRAAARREDV